MPNYFPNSDWTPSCTGDNGWKVKGKIENRCSFDDICWNRHPSALFRHMPQLMTRDWELLCSIWTRRSPSANRSSTPSTYNLMKWFGDISDLGIHTSPTLGMLLCLSANSGFTLRKVGSEIEVGLELWGECPSSDSIGNFQPHPCPCEVPTVGYLHRNIPCSCLIGIYTNQPDHSKSQCPQNHCSMLRTL